MTFEPQNAFERSLIQASSDPVHRPQFYKDLAAAEFFIIQEGTPPEGSGRTILKEEYSLKLRNINWNGKPFIPVFSSLPRLRAAVESEVSYIALNALEFMKMARGAELILNPGSDYAKEFTKAEIESILDGSIWKRSEDYVVEKATEVMIGQPSNYPKELVDALARYFRKTKEVKRAYLAHFFNPQQDEKPHTLIGVEMTGDWESVMSGAGTVTQGVPIPDPPVDFIQITGKTGVEDFFLKAAASLFMKGSSSGFFETRWGDGLPFQGAQCRRCWSEGVALGYG
jgi:hypothetical protein